MKKVLFLFSLLLTLSIPSVTGAEGKGDKVIDPYTGDEIGAFFEIGEDGQLIEKPVEELAQKLEESKRIEKQMKSMDSKSPEFVDSYSIKTGISAASSYTTYKYNENYRYQIIGAAKRVSDDIYCNNSYTDCPISTARSETYTRSYSLNVDTSYERSAVNRGLDFTYNYSASNSTSIGYTLYVERGKEGYLAFYPYYEYSAGYLNKYIRGRYTSREWATATIPKKLNGYAAGGFAIIYK